MLPIQLACLLHLVAPGPGTDALRAVRLDVLEGSVRVLAGETWLGLARGGELPESGPHTILSMDWNARARLTIAGAGVDLQGPLEVESTHDGEWTVRMSGGGRAQVNARSAPVHVELASSARLEMNRGAYWIEGVPAGGWRVGCDAGEPLILCSAQASSWWRSPRVESGAVLRLIPAEVAGPAAPNAGRRLAVPAWESFSWPWTNAAAGR